MAQQQVTHEGIGGFKRELTLLFLINLFIFTGAGAQQQYLAPYLDRIGGWSGLARAFVPATVYFSMLIFRVGNVFLLRRLPQWLWIIVGSACYLLFTVALAAMGWSPTYAIAIVAAAVWGWGGAAFWGGATVQTLAVADEGKRYGLGTGILYTASNLGWVLGVILLGWVFSLKSMPPQSIYIVASAFTLLGVALTPFLWRKGLPEVERPTFAQIRQLLVHPKAVLAGFLLLSSSLCFGIMLGQFADFVGATYGREWIWRTAVFYPFSSLLCSIAGGWIYDRVGPGWILGGSFFGTAAALVAAGEWGSPATLALAAFALGVLSTVVPIVAAAIVGDSAERKARPLAYGVLFTWRDFGVVAAIIGSKLLGIATGDFASVFTIFAGIFVVCGVVGLLLQRYASARF
jgi:MFS family permease